MKTLRDYINEQLNTVEDITIVEAKESIKSEEDFRAAAKAKFEEVFGDELDEDKMNETIEGLLKDNEDLVKDGKWGELIGMLNKSFAE
jgi:hypothetical protein